jgi:hypothetical protein
MPGLQRVEPYFLINSALRMRISFEADTRPAVLHPCSILPVFEAAKPALRRNRNV